MFTLTLIKDGEESKILVTDGETPAKAEEEADAVISKSALASTYKAIVDAIPNFRDAEDGCEDWITHSIEEFLDIYDLDLVKVFEDAENESIEKVDEEAGEETESTSEEDLSEKDKTGENTTEEEVEEEGSDEPEFDSDLFGGSDGLMTEPGEIFLVTFKPENLQSIRNSINFDQL